MMYRIEECQVVGAMLPWFLAAPFARAPAVLQRKDAPGHYLVAERYRSGGVEGEEFKANDWKGLLQCEEALEISSPVDASQEATVWIFRGGSEDIRLRLESLDVLRTERICPADPEVRAWVVSAPQANLFATKVAGEQFSRAYMSGQQGDFETAYQAARLAYLLEPRISEEKMGLLAATCLLIGDRKRHDGYFAMAKNSFSPKFVKEMEQKCSSLLQKWGHCH